MNKWMNSSVCKTFKCQHLHLFLNIRTDGGLVPGVVEEATSPQFLSEPVNARQLTVGTSRNNAVSNTRSYIWLLFFFLVLSHWGPWKWRTSASSVFVSQLQSVAWLQSQIKLSHFSGMWRINLVSRPHSICLMLSSQKDRMPRRRVWEQQVLFVKCPHADVAFWRVFFLFYYFIFFWRSCPFSLPFESLASFRRGTLCRRLNLV